MGNPYSNLKIFRHKEYLDAIERDEWKSPIYIRIKPTNLCNHHCSYCTYGSGDTLHRTNNRDSVDHRSMIPRDKMREILSDITEMGVKAITFSGGGEPLVYPYITEAAGELLDRGVDISLISNGELLEGERAEVFRKAKWIRVSFDSPNEEEYCKLRGLESKDFQRVITNISNFAKSKEEGCVLGINYVIGRSNYKRVYEAAALMKGMGVNNIKFAALVDNSPGYHQEIKDDVMDQIHWAMKDLSDRTFLIINNYENDWMDKNFDEISTPKCYTCRLVTVIAADQRVYLCHTRAYDSRALIGDLMDQSFAQMWYSKDTIRRLKMLDPKRDCHNNCAYRGRNEVILSYLQTKEHVNFI